MKNENNYFVNREDEITTLFDAFQQGKQINIYGIVGIGKTEFLNYFLREVEKLRKFIPIEISLPDSKVENLQNLLEIIAEAGDDRLGGSGISGASPFFVFRKHLNENEHPEQNITIALFSAALNSIKSSNKILLCFDNTENVSTEVWEQFEDEILRFYLRTGRGLDSDLRIITVGQQQMHWTFFRMRKQTEARLLTLF